jgi:hypothetical protein
MPKRRINWPIIMGVPGSLGALIALWILLGFPTLATSGDIHWLDRSQSDLATTITEARFYWPWERQRHRSRLHRGQRTEIVLPNCQQINEAAKTLEPDRFERALRSSSKRQREIIAKCQGRTQP